MKVIIKHEGNIFNLLTSINNYLFLKKKNSDCIFYLLINENLKEIIYKFLILENKINLITSLDSFDLNKSFYIIDNISTLFNKYISNGILIKKYIYNNLLIINTSNNITDLKLINNIKIRETNYYENIISDKLLINKNIYLLFLEDKNINFNKELCALNKLKKESKINIFNINYDLNFNKILLNIIKKDKNHLIISNVILKGNINSNIKIINIDKNDYLKKISSILSILNKNLIYKNIFINRYSKIGGFLFNFLQNKNKIKLINLSYPKKIEIFLDKRFISNEIKDKLILEFKKKYKSILFLNYDLNNSDIVLLPYTKNNKDLIFSDINFFNKLVISLPYILALEYYFDINLDINNNIYYPIKNIWQTPAATEYMSYLQVRFSNKIHNYVAFPWAVLYDNEIITDNHKNINLPLVDIFNSKKKRNIFKNGVTVIQIIEWRKYIKLFRYLGIKIVFASHCSKKEVFNNLVVYPYFLYSYTYGIYNKKKYEQIKSDMIISVSTNQDRENICDILDSCNGINVIKNRNWFFKDIVYNYQLYHKFIIDNKIDMLFENHLNYMKKINNSSFQICLKGAGDNTIRIFESLKMNLVPIIDFDFNLNSKYFNLDLFIIKLNFNSLFNHIEKKKEIDSFKINGILLKKIISNKRNLINKFYGKININCLYKNYIESNLFSN